MIERQGQSGQMTRLVAEIALVCGLWRADVWRERQRYEIARAVLRAVIDGRL